MPPRWHRSLVIVIASRDPFDHRLQIKLAATCRDGRQIAGRYTDDRRSRRRPATVRAVARSTMRRIQRRTRGREIPSGHDRRAKWPRLDVFEISEQRIEVRAPNRHFTRPVTRRQPDVPVDDIANALARKRRQAIAESRQVRRRLFQDPSTRAVTGAVDAMTARALAHVERAPLVDQILRWRWGKSCRCREQRRGCDAANRQQQDSHWMRRAVSAARRLRKVAASSSG
jgi:hypothetical protein